MSRLKQLLVRLRKYLCDVFARLYADVEEVPRSHSKKQTRNILKIIEKALTKSSLAILKLQESDRKEIAFRFVDSEFRNYLVK